MTFSMPGLIGAAIGLVIALVTYLTVMPLLARSGTEAGASAAKPNVDAVRMVLLADFVVLAVVGYYVGQLLFS